MSIPAPTRAAMRSGEAVAGPIVQTILARRAVVATGARPGAGVRSRVSVIASDPRGGHVSDRSRGCEGRGNSARISVRSTMPTAELPTAELLAEKVAAARSLADEVLFPAALAVDRADAVPAGHLDRLADAGLYALAGPPEAGGLGSDPHAVAPVVEALAGGRPAGVDRPPRRGRLRDQQPPPPGLPGPRGGRPVLHPPRPELLRRRARRRPEGPRRGPGRRHARRPGRRLGAGPAGGGGAGGVGRGPVQPPRGARPAAGPGGAVHAGLREPGG